MAVKGVRTIRILAIINDEVNEFKLDNIRYILSKEVYFLSTTYLDISRYTYNRDNSKKISYKIVENKIL